MNFQQLLEQFVTFSMQKVLIIGLALSGAYYFTLYNDGATLTNQIMNLKTQLQQEEEKEKDTRKTLEEKDRIERQVNKLIQEYKDISSKLPSSLTGVDVVKLIDIASKDSKVSVKKQSAGQIIQKEVHEEIPVNIDLKGSFQQISQFIYLISNNERISRVQNIKIEGSDPIQLEKGKVILKLEGEVVGYRFVGESKK
ncbi:MAG TPA: type 4a pilus biogenesis protein PilO [Pseudobdellovibrionaceae bacterium]|nr:type 4a pilus biogenesis protein PilO [Pseudobdellovibrionaceae bacterium]